MNIKFGLKLWSSNTNLINQAVQLIDEKIFDYIELFVIPDTSISPFLIDVPYIIHIPHHKFGVNIGEPSKKEYNLQKINESAMWADNLNAKYLILHAGHGSIEHAVNILSEVSDNRLIIENMPKIGLNNEMMIGYSPEHILKLIEVNETGLCMDFGHAAKAAVSLEENYKEFIKEFLVFEPKVFHISDGNLSNEKDEHLNIGEGDYDFQYLMECINGNPSKFVTIETTRTNLRLLVEDIQNLNKLKTMQFH